MVGMREVWTADCGGVEDVLGGVACLGEVDVRGVADDALVAGTHEVLGPRRVGQARLVERLRSTVREGEANELARISATRKRTKYGLRRAYNKGNPTSFKALGQSAVPCGRRAHRR